MQHELTSSTHDVNARDENLDVDTIKPHYLAIENEFNALPGIKIWHGIALMARAYIRVSHKTKNFENGKQKSL